MESFPASFVSDSNREKAGPIPRAARLREDRANSKSSHRRRATPGERPETGAGRETTQRQAPGERRRSGRQRTTRDRRWETDDAGKQRRPDRVRASEAAKQSSWEREEMG